MNQPRKPFFFFSDYKQSHEFFSLYNVSTQTDVLLLFQHCHSNAKHMSHFLHAFALDTTAVGAQCDIML